MTDKLSIGRIVHYKSFGTPGGEYHSECRAAIVAGINEDGLAELVILNPTGLFFNACTPGDSGGTWHWPERTDG